MRSRFKLQMFIPFVALLIVLCMPRVVFAHAVLVSSTPTANASISGSNVVVHLKFNSRIDASHSRLYLAAPDGKVSVLKTASGDAPDELTGEGLQLKPGAYQIRWQVLASDGHLTRGEVPFTVQ